MIYLDYAATTPMAPEAIRVYQEVASNYFGNANSLHTKGTDAANVAQAALSTLRNTIPDTSVHLTRSGSEANQHAIDQLLNVHNFKGHILTCRTEHPSIREHLQKLIEIYPGLIMEDVPVDEQGHIHPSAVEARIKPDTILVTFAHVQHEIGTIRDISAIGEVLTQAGISFHSDCVQSYGKIPIPMKQAGLAAISVAAHKIHGPKGLGAVFFSKTFQPNDELPTGTADGPAIAAFAEAAQIQVQKTDDSITHTRQLRAKMIERLPADVQILGAPADHRQSPYILGLCLPKMEGQEAMLACDRQGIAIATGSACRSGDHKPSETLLALGHTPDKARTFIRLSFSHETCLSEIEQAATRLTRIRARRLADAEKIEWQGTPTADR
ncbi:IscS subfamily cysteine desulfurase [Natribacillus halophilus]|uniref:Cysteine desulfurase n=1 Tax=Natribacillus halophilus TaxID=549003 RepID=A0A1G8N433_9BACI|nr:IscS subfamily cysteine desulfurase [Natribacillus halophilus]SDI74856.1 cysteine desulfurase [Natribacillus halophilus]